MPSFIDRKGRTWEVEFTVATARRIKSLLQVDPLGAPKPDAAAQTRGLNDFLVRLISDTVFLVDALFVVCKPQADAISVNDECFAEGLAGQAIADASAALLESIADFSQHPEERAALRRVLNVTKRRTATELAKLETTASEAAIERSIDEWLLRSGTPSTPMQAGSG